LSTAEFPCRDLLSDEEIGLTAEGFDATENALGRRWRWALGEEQRIRFAASSARHAVYLTVEFPNPESWLRVFCGERLVFEHRSTRARESRAAFFSIAHGPGPTELRFLSNPPPAPAGQDRRALAYVVKELRIVPAELSGAAARPTPASLCAFPFVMSYLEHRAQPGPCCWAPLFRDGGVRHSTTQSDAGGHRGGEPTGNGLAGRYWNHPELKALRVQMLAGVRPASCADCYRLEDRGGESLRRLFNAEYLEAALPRIARVGHDGTMPEGPYGLDLRLGNLCNLKCRMCFPIRSSALLQEHNEVYGADFSDDAESGKWLKDPARMDELVHACAGLEEIRLVGGEPFVMPEFTTLLRELVERGIARDLRLVFHTNCTVLREEPLALLKQFREVTCLVSLEGVREVNDFIRFPSKFAQVERNLRRLADERAQLGITRLELTTTVQVHNVTHLPELLTYLRENFRDIAWLPNFLLLYEPAPFSITVLSAQGKRTARATLEDFLDRERAVWREKPAAFGSVPFPVVEERLRSVLRYLDSADDSRLAPEFRRVHASLDRARGQRGPSLEGLL
jgi:pyruvate-formate lyase-activating enzyme